MVHITEDNGNFVFTVEGMHKLWSFKSHLTIPAGHIMQVTRELESINGWHGWRLPGTQIPSVITAGTFYQDGKRIFWDAVHKENCIIIYLQDEEYQELIIEVEDPIAAIQLLANNKE